MYRVTTKNRLPDEPELLTYSTLCFRAHRNLEIDSEYIVRAPSVESSHVLSILISLIHNPFRDSRTIYSKRYVLDG